MSETPMLTQYRSIKAKYKDCILLFRLGDFYEMFYDDAALASKTLNLVLTSRGKDPTGKIPMCGVPYHAVDNYIAKIIKAGYKVAICEQMEDPSTAKTIVRRDVIRVITAGTYLDEHNNDARYLMCLSPDVSAGASPNGKSIGVAFTDPVNGTIQTNQYPIDSNKLAELISKISVQECIYPQGQDEEIETKIKDIFNHSLLRTKQVTLSPFSSWCFNTDIARKSLCEHFDVHNLSGFGIEELPLAVAVSGALLEYLKEMNKHPLRHIDKITLYNDEDYVFISPAAMRGLEIESLIKTMDHTLTALGQRMFNFWITHPLKDPTPIIKRQEAIQLFTDNPSVGQGIERLFARVPDLEKNISRLSCGYTHARDLLAIRNTLVLAPKILATLKPIIDKNSLFTLEDIPELRQYLENAVNPEIPLSHPEGKVIREGFNAELDELRGLQENGRQWLKRFQEDEIKRTQINSLKVGFNQVFGYYIEITRANLHLVPQDYIRKQTLVNGERYITPGLKEYEEKILTTETKILKIEQELIKEIEQKILQFSSDLHRFCQAIAIIDTLYSLHTLARSPGYSVPTITNNLRLKIRNGRHPVVEKILAETFVPNDTLLDSNENHLIVLTGPNMAGKSTYIRQTALLVIMAQSGSFIPAESASIGIVDKIFTRIGAHDDLNKGQSTFMVEMNETADILNNMTDRSLIILDEIGRGTSTYDGLSLAWAIAEHLSKTKARTLFATHFHELTALAKENNGIKNYNVAVKEWKDEIIFLHKIIPGSTDDSYGIYVAKLAGIPQAVVNRAKHVLTQLELKNDLKNNIPREGQINLFNAPIDPTAAIIKETLEAMDINSLTPLQALNKMQELKNLIN